MTQKELARKLGISQRHLRRLAALGMPTDSLAAARAWRAANIDAPADDNDLNTLRGDVMRKRAELLDIEIKERVRDLMPAEEVRRLLVGMATSVRARLLNARERFMAQHPNLPREAYATVQKLHDEALALMAEDVLNERRAAD